MPGDSSESYRIVIAYTEKEIHNIKQMCAFSGYKTGFVRLGHYFACKLTTWLMLILFWCIGLCHTVGFDAKDDCKTARARKGN